MLENYGIGINGNINNSITRKIIYVLCISVNKNKNVASKNFNDIVLVSLC